MKKNNLINELYKEILDEKELLKTIATKLTKKTIDDSSLRDRWDDFNVEANKQILLNDFSAGEACLLRMWVAFDKSGTLMAIINGQAVYLNAGNALLPHCLYVFDIPLNREDRFNIAYSVNAKCKIMRLQVVRIV